MKPEQKQAQKDQYRARRELRHNTLHKDSIAMANPFYNSMDDSPWGSAFFEPAIWMNMGYIVQFMNKIRCVAYISLPYISYSLSVIMLFPELFAFQ